MSDFKYNIAKRDGDPESITIFSSGRPTLIGTPDNAGFSDVLTMVNQPDTTYDTLANKLSAALAVGAAFKRLSDRVSVRGGAVFFDNDRVDNSLTKAIATFHASGATQYEALVNFMEKVMQNPEPHSREQLYDWMIRWNFGIAPDGDIIAYKGLNRSHRDADKEAWESSSAGHAIVNGKPFDGCIPGFPGAVIEMPRSEVNHDPSTGCSTGLHVGNWDYASSFAQVTVRVKVNPRDVCSVPTDCSWQKVRCCRYTLMGLVTEQDTEVLIVPEAYKTLCASALDPEFERLLAEEAAIETAHQAKKASPVKKSSARKVPAKKATTKKTVSKKVQPMTGGFLFYEDMKKADLAKVPFNELRWVAKEWAIKGLSGRPSKDELVSKIAVAATGRRRQAKFAQKSYTPTTR